MSVGDPQLTRKSNLRIRLLVGCDGLEKDAARFRSGRNAHTTGPSCKLCDQGAVEDATHFIVQCPVLAEVRLHWIQELPTSRVTRIQCLLPDRTSAPDDFVHVMLGSHWMHNADLQTFCTELLSELRFNRLTAKQGP